MPTSILDSGFFQRDPVTCARELIGCELVWGRCAGIVVETEAYSAVGDEAAHTFTRPSAREFVTVHPAGTAYIYLNYGVHWLANVLIKGNVQGFVLLRALEPVRGITAMKRRRGQDKIENLCSGPGKLTRALGIEGRHHGKPYAAGSSGHFRARPGGATVEIESDARIGISRATGLPWRFLLKGSRFVSKRVQLNR